MEIVRAGRQDMEEILALQKLAYQSEAELLGDYTIQPLTQTLEEALAEFDGAVVLKGVEGGRIVGSIRGTAREGTLYVGKLMVHPDFRGRGYGKQLLAAIEAACPQPRCELFTSSLSERNLGLYERAGYARFRERQVSDKVRFVYLEKRREAGE